MADKLAMAKSKRSAAKEATRDYIRRRKIEKIKSFKGKLKFELTADEIRHHDR
jgi:hypothetical protein